ncbi:hypothetical protein PAAG_03822 [Paracoccidioides lutzii Pb01]|uniref:Uncharacterized protein n=1 Tax=Paracoccidioides lutzii (strain ATCC MYA-826 / Pb01) TaxID=502779 RepID=C1GZ78_PARBA|nr:hypothetical protein PAAG_03822 [Paracoccidioides lutzii Pb01]EEH41902.2 hypothetical protein PAAG_03822 [Paracoccidioides lutzii Pb01]
MAMKLILIRRDVRCMGMDVRNMFETAKLKLQSTCGLDWMSQQARACEPGSRSTWKRNELVVGISEIPELGLIRTVEGHLTRKERAKIHRRFTNCTVPHPPHFIALLCVDDLLDTTLQNTAILDWNFVIFTKYRQLISLLLLFNPLRFNTSVTMSETFQELADIPKDFVKDGMLFMNRCTKPDKREFLKISQAVGFGFLIMGAIGYFIKLSE